MAAEIGEIEAGPSDDYKGDLLHVNVGAWIFLIPKNKLASFPESLLYQESCLSPECGAKKIFLDRDGLVFTNIHQFLLTSQLPISSSSELELLYEQARGFNLQTVTEALDKLKAGKEEKTLYDQTTPDIPTNEKTTKNYWKSHKCSNKLSEWPPKMSLSPGILDRAPLGLLHNPLLAAEEEVHYCFFPTDIIEKYPALVTDDNLIWFSEKFILIECGCPEFRFIGNFLYYGKFFLPENFSAFDVLEAEINSLKIPCLLKALYDEKMSTGSNRSHGVDMPVMWHSSKSLTASRTDHRCGAKPFYIMSLEILGKYSDSALGQLYIESSVDGSKLYISGTGTLFQHVKNWLGACRLPLSSNALEIQGLCLYLDEEDLIYQPMKEAIREHLKNRLIISPGALCESWIADVQQYSATQIVRVYVRSHWYATHLKTLLKYPELLANTKKTRWIIGGFSLLVIGDGSIFRHILNFLRLGRILLPSGFNEWKLLCWEVNEFKIPALNEALCHCLEYRLWLREQETTECSLDSKHENMTCNIICPQMIHIDRSQGISKIKDDARCFTTAKGLKRVDFCKREASSTSLFKTLECSNPGDFPGTKYVKLDQSNVETKVTSSPILRLISLVKRLSDRDAKDSGCKELQRNGRLNTFPTLSRRGTMKMSQRCIADEGIKQHKLNRRPAKKIVPTKSLVLKGGDKENLVWPIHRSGSFRSIPVQKDKMLAISHNDKKLDTRHEEVLPSLSTCPGQRMEVERITAIEHAYYARSPHVKGKKFADLGTILWVHHHHLMANDGSSASFQDSIVYTTEHDIKNLTQKTTSDDLVFLSVNMSHEEVFYARKCHFFLAGVILDSLEQRDPKSTTLCVAGLVSMLWTSQIPARQFVDDLFALEMYNDDEGTKEALVCWLKLTLTFAKKLSQCITVMLRKKCHKFSSSCILRKVLS